MKKILLISLSTVIIAITSVYCEDAKTIFENKCASCHGKDGKGQTKLGQKLEVRDFTDPKVQESMKEEEIFKAIKEGIKVGDEVKMKGFGDKLKDDDIKALVAYIRFLKK